MDRVLVKSVFGAVALALVGVVSCNAWTTQIVGEEPASRRITVDHPGLPLRALSEQELDRFKRGDALFEATIRESDGLGPLYVRDSCSACHAGDGRGPGLVTKVSVVDQGDFDELLPFGPTERPYMSAGAKQPLLVKSDPRVRVTHRLPPAVFGRGYLEAIAEQDLERLEQLAQARSGSARGRVNRLESGAIGRFGVKARLVSLEGFTADALNGDMGVTSPTRPAEPAGPEGLSDDHKPGVDFSQENVELLRDYLRFLEIPERRAFSESGGKLFASAGCADCHTPSFTTASTFPVKALAGVRADVYTDLLLHDMGKARADGQSEGSAGPRDFRTAPLIGLRFLPSLLHDGSAKTVETAILAHGDADSEGRDSVRRFQQMPETERRELVRFVEAL